MQRLSELGREAGLFHRQSRTADEHKDSLSITEHILLTEAMKNPGEVGEKEREWSKRDAGTSSGCLLSIYSKESSKNTSGGHSCFTGTFKSVYGMICVEWLCWKQFRGGMLLLKDFFLSSIWTFLTVT